MSDVITLASKQIRLAPIGGTNISSDYLVGLGTIDERKFILVDTKRLMSPADITLLEEIAD